MLRAVVAASVYVQLGHTADYDSGLAARLVNYCGAAYCGGTESVTQWTCSACKDVPGFTNIAQAFGPVHHGRAIIGFDHVLQARIVSFMGTNTEFKTWIDDINVLPTACYTDACPGCTCHPGFKETFDEIAYDVYTAASNLPPGKLIITGHSLGAAQATHCAYHFHTKGLKPDHIYTVGQPRVGNDAFSSFYRSLDFDHWRVTHHRDPVPHLPWRGIGSYRQTLREAYYKDAAAGPPTRICSPTNPEDPMCADQFNDELTLLHITDHWYYLGFNFATDMISCTITSSNSSLTLV